MLATLVCCVLSSSAAARRQQGERERVCVRLC